MATKSSSRGIALGLSRESSPPTIPSQSKTGVSRTTNPFRQSFKEKCDRRIRGSSSLHFAGLPSAKIRRRVETNPGSLQVKQIPSSHSLSTSHNRTSQTFSQQTEVADETRPKRCLPSRSYPPSIQEISLLQMGRENFLLQSYALRTLNRPCCVHRVDGLPFKDSKGKEHLCSCLSGRLVNRDRHFRRRPTGYCLDSGDFHKSRLPNQSREILSLPFQKSNLARIRLNAEKGLVRLPLKKVMSIIRKASRLELTREATRRELESLIGEMGFAAQALPEAGVRKKYFQLVLKHWPRIGRDVTNLINPQALADLRWWTNKANLHVWFTFRKPLLRLMLWADESLQGWGAHSENGSWIAENWHPSLHRESIAELELLAILHGIQSHIVPTDVSLIVHTDSLVAYWTIKSRGSKTSRHLTKIVHQILNQCHLKSIHLEPVRIPGSLNVVADGLSRNCLLPGEWRINKLDWERLIRWKGPFQIDLMATPFNRLLPTFVSPFHHPQEEAVDVKMVDWNRWSIVYVFPPPAMLPWILDRLLTYKGKAVIVARVQKMHPCYPLLQSMMEDSLLLRYPPFQLVREKRVEDLEHWSCPWTAFHFSGQD